MRKVYVDMKIVVKAMSRGNELSLHSVSQVTSKFGLVRRFPIITADQASFPLSPIANETGVKCLAFKAKQTYCTYSTTRRKP